jgi:AcrR family transcriptional regulator
MTQFSERQKEIINESLRLIANSGIQNLTIKNLAKAVNISEPAIYRHFTDKMDILLNIVIYLTISEKWILKKAREAGPAALDQVEGFFVEHFRQIAADKNSTVLRCSEALFQYDPQLSKKIISMHHMSRDTLREFVEHGQKTDKIRTDISANQLTIVIMGAFRYFITSWQQSGFSFDLEAEGEKQAKAIKQMITNPDI